jgi:hypothetical protein
MKLVIEIDNVKELKKAERFAKQLRPSEVRIKNKLHKIRSFLDYTDKTAVSVKK